MRFSFGACADPLVGQTPITSSAGAVTAGVVRTTVASTLSGNNLVVTLPSTLTLPADVTAPTPFYVCAYEGNTVGSTAALAGTATAVHTVNPMLTASPSSGASGGGYSVDLTTPNPAFTAFSTSYTVQFQAKTAAGAVCAATPQGASAPSASNATTITGGVIVIPAASLQVPTSRSMKVQVPATMVQPYLTTLPTVTSSNFNVCVYASNALVAETATGGPFNLSGNRRVARPSPSPARTSRPRPAP